MNLASRDTIESDCTNCIMDSGASVHICGNRRMFVGNLRPCKVAVRCADSNKVVARQCGEVVLTLQSGSRLWLRNVLYIPDAPMLVSIPVLMDDNAIDIVFRSVKRTCTLYDEDGEWLTTIKRDAAGTTNKLYSLVCMHYPGTCCICQRATPTRTSVRRIP